MRKINSSFTFEFIQKNPREYQAHLERIADFLLTPNTWVETDKSIEFKDVEGEWSKPLQHFRSTSLAENLRAVKKNWIECEKQMDCFIPAFIIIDDSGKQMNVGMLKEPPELFKEAVATLPTPFVPDSTMSPIFTTPSTVNKLTSTLGNSTPTIVTSITEVSPTTKRTPTKIQAPSLTSTPLAAPRHHDHKNSTTSLMKVAVGNTGKVLIAVLPGMLKKIEEYTTLKEKCKNAPHFQSYLEDFKKVSAELSVKIQIVYEKTWNELHNLEKDILSQKTSRFEAVSDRLKELKRLLSLCEKLKKPFQLQDIMLL